MKVKICGITNREDAAMCEDLGADALGFVHFPGRARSRTLSEIADMCSSIGSLTAKVLICAPTSVTEALSMLYQSGADGLQLYSLEPEETRTLKMSGASVMRVVKPDRMEAVRFSYAVDAIVFENGKPGTGSTYDYSKVPIDSCSRAIIAGGLNLDTLGSAKQMRPYGLDVSSGVERVQGKKDAALVSEFIRRSKE